MLKKTFVINLDRRPARLANFLKNYPFPKESIDVFKAIDGHDLDITNDIELLEVFRIAVENNILGGKKGVSGCALSHYKLWNIVAKDKILNDNDWILIFEDDPNYTINFNEKFKQIFDNDLSGYDFIYIGGKVEINFKTTNPNYLVEKTTNLYQRIKSKEPTELYESHDWNRLSQSYLVTKKGCRQLIKELKKTLLTAPIDTLISSAWNKLSMADYFPHLCYDGSYDRSSDCRLNTEILEYKPLYEKCAAQSTYVSIIIPFNSDFSLLQETINSVKNQTYANYEIIIGTYGLDRKFNVSSLVSDKIRLNQYETKSRSIVCNNLLKECRHDIVCLLNPGDKWRENKLEEQLIVWTMHTYDIIGSLASGMASPAGDIKENDFLSNNPINTSSVMFHKKIGYWSSDSYGLEDYDMWLRLCYQKKKFYNMDEILVDNGNRNDDTKESTLKLLEKWKKKFGSKQITISPTKQYENTDITIVTCYFKVPAKVTPETYYEWMGNFLRLPRNMVIFTDEETRERIEGHRATMMNKTHIIVDKFENFKMLKHMDYWKYCETVDVERKNHNHNSHLYTLWNEKIYLMKRAVDINPFKSDWFFWADIGCCRNAALMDKFMAFPNKDKIKSLPADKITMFTISAFWQGDLTVINKNGVPELYQHVDGLSRLVHRIQGGFWGGRKEMFDTFVKLYGIWQEKFMANKLFCGREECIMSAIRIMHPDFCNVIEANASFGDRWFYFLHYFA